MLAWNTITAIQRLKKHWITTVKTHYFSAIYRRHSISLLEYLNCCQNFSVSHSITSLALGDKSTYFGHVAVTANHSLNKLGPTTCLAQLSPKKEHTTSLSHGAGVVWTGLGSNKQGLCQSDAIDESWNLRN